MYSAHFAHLSIPLAPTMCQATCYPQQWRRQWLYLGGAEAAAVTVVPWADGKHTSQPLLPPPTGLAGSRFRLGLHRCPTGWLTQEIGYLGFLPSHHPRLRPPRQVPAVGFHAKQLRLLLRAWDPGCPQGCSVELSLKGTYSKWLGEWHFHSFGEYMWFFTGYTNTACYMYNIPICTAHRLLRGQAD